MCKQTWNEKVCRNLIQKLQGELNQTMEYLAEQTLSWYQMIWDKTLFHKTYNNLMFNDDFLNN